MAERPVRIISKQTAVPGRVPTGTTGNETSFIKQGELAQNTADRKLFGFNGSNIFEFGSNSFLYLTGGTISGNLNIGNTLTSSTLNAGIILSAGTNLYNIFQTIGSGVGTPTYVQSGLNTYTGGTANAPTINISAATLSSVSATTVSGGTIYSGGTELSSLFGSASSVATLQSQIVTKANLSGATFTGTVVAPSLSATTLSADTIYSGSTNLSSIFGSLAAQQTLQSQIVTKANLSGATFTGAVVVTSLSATTISGGTIYSGNTPLETVITNIANALELNDVTRVQPGLNTYTGGTTNAPTINISAATLSSLSSVTISAATYYSGNTPLQAALSLLPLSGGTLTGNLYPNPSNSLTLGDASARWSVGYINQFDITNSGGYEIYFNGAGSANIYQSNSGSDIYLNTNSGNILIGNSDGASTLAVRGATIYANALTGTSISATTYYSGTTALSLIINSIATASTLTSNGLSKSASTAIELGGALIKETTIDLVSAYKLQVSNAGVSRFGINYNPSTALGIPQVYINGTLTAGAVNNGGYQTAKHILSGDPSSPTTSGVLIPYGELHVTVPTTMTEGAHFYIGSDGTNYAYNWNGSAKDYAGAGYSQLVQADTGMSYKYSGVTKFSVSNSGLATAASISATTISGGTIYSGGTDLYNIFQTIGSGVGTPTYVQPGLNIYTGGTANNPTINISAATLTYLSATTISGGTIYSGSTPLETVITNIANALELNDLTRVQPGLNTYTGGTANAPTINISAATLSYLSASTVSADTIYSGSTNLSSIFGSLATQQTLQSQIVTKANLSGATFTGAVVAPSLSATTISGGTIYSGGTDLYSIFATIGSGPGTPTYVQPGLNIYTGGTAALPTINISAATLSSMSATTISGETIYSGTTSIENIFLIKAGTARITVGTSQPASPAVGDLWVDTN